MNQNERAALQMLAAGHEFQATRLRMMATMATMAATADSMRKVVDAFLECERRAIFPGIPTSRTSMRS